MNLKELQKVNAKHARIYNALSKKNKPTKDLLLEYYDTNPAEVEQAISIIDKATQWKMKSCEKTNLV